MKGTWREGFLAWEPEGYVEMALETGISFHRGPIWGTWRRAQGMGLLSLMRLCGGGLGGAPSLGTLEDMFR